MPELASEACGVLGAGLSKERMMLPNTTETSCFTGGTPHLMFYLCCLKIMVAGNLKTATVFVYVSSLYASTSSKAYSLINFQLGGTEILFDEVELQRVTGIHFCMWSCFQAPFLKWNFVRVNFQCWFYQKPD